MSVAAYTLLFADCLGKRSTDGDSNILHRVMRVYLQIALRLDLEIQQPVLRDLIQHVFQKRNADRETRLAPTV